jgi:tetratricopeptide (TPR) repeat protein
VNMLQVGELDADQPWVARLRYAYANALLAVGRRDEAREWFARAAEVDEDALTDAAEQLLALDGVVLDDLDENLDEDLDEDVGDEDVEESPRDADDETATTPGDGETVDDGAEPGDDRGREDADGDADILAGLSDVEPAEPDSSTMDIDEPGQPANAVEKGSR